MNSLVIDEVKVGNLLLHTGIEVKVLDVIVISTEIDQRDVFNLWSEGKREGRGRKGEREREKERERKTIIINFRKLRSKGVFGCSNLSSATRSFQLRTVQLHSVTLKGNCHINMPTTSTALPSQHKHYIHNVTMSLHRK